MVLNELFFLKIVIYLKFNQIELFPVLGLGFNTTIETEIPWIA